MKISQEEKITKLLADFEVLLTDKTVDHSKIMEQAKKIEILLLNAGIKADRGYAHVHEDGIQMSVQEEQGTFGSRKVFYMTTVAAVLMGAGGLANFATLFTGAALATAMATGLGQVGQGLSLATKIPEESNQGIRVATSANREAERQKFHQSKDSARELSQKIERIKQQSDEELKRESHIKAEMARA